MIFQPKCDHTDTDTPTKEGLQPTDNGWKWYDPASNSWVYLQEIENGILGFEVLTAAHEREALKDLVRL